MKKSLVCTLTPLLLLSLLSVSFNVMYVVADPQVIRVPGDYPTMQEAINAASPGDTIIVSSGLYAEGQINVNKSLSLLADGGVLVDGLKKGHVFYVTASHVAIEGFTVKNSKTDVWGIKLNNVQNCTLKRNIIQDCWKGVTLSLSNNNTVVGNRLLSTWRDGVYLLESSNNKIINNTMTGIGSVSLIRSENNTLSGNTISSSSGCGVHLGGSRYNNITSNRLYGPEWGIDLDDSTNNIIMNNTVTYGGVSISTSSNNTLSNNTIATDRGVYLSGSSNNTLTANDAIAFHLINCRNNELRNNKMKDFEIKGEELSDFINDVDTSNVRNGKPMYYWINEKDVKIPSDAGFVALINCTRITVENLGIIGGQSMVFTYRSQGIVLAFTINSTIRNTHIRGHYCGIWLYVSSDNTIYHNNFTGNANHFHSEGSTNTWDAGYPCGGNYWSNYEEADEYCGADQDHPGSDGIGDFPYVIDMFNQDRFPFMRPINLFDAGTWDGITCHVDISSNSTVSNFQLNTTLKTITFNVTGKTGLGFCRVTIPNIIVQDLWQGNYTVLIGGEPPLDVRNWTDTENTCTYFTYQHSEHEVIIVPEFSSATILLLFMVATLCTVTAYRIRTRFT